MNVTRILGLAAIGGLLMLAAPTDRAQALSLASPGTATAVQDDSKLMTTEVRYHHHYHHHHHRYHRHYRHHRHWGYHRHHHRHHRHY
jgi:hypothetical protein